MTSLERRNLVADNAVEGRTLSGYAAVYGRESRELFELGKPFTERIAQGAFDATLAAGADVKLYYNHDASMPLARTKSGTLSLRSDRDGLAFEATIPETTLGNDIVTLMRRGDLSGEMSFGFYVEKDEWNKTRTERLVTQARLVEISIVQDAAYPQTKSSLRCVSARDRMNRALYLRGLKGRL